MTPGKPNNFTVKSISSKTVQISWLDPVVASVKPFTHLWIVLKQKKALYYNIIFDDVDKKPKNSLMFKNLAPFTNYSGYVSLANNNGYGEKFNFLFITAEAGKTIFCVTAIVFVYDCINAENYDYHHIYITI